MESFEKKAWCENVKNERAKPDEDGVECAFVARRNRNSIDPRTRQLPLWPMNQSIERERERTSRCDAGLGVGGAGRRQQRLNGADGRRGVVRNLQPRSRLGHDEERRLRKEKFQLVRVQWRIRLLFAASLFLNLFAKTTRVSPIEHRFHGSREAIGARVFQHHSAPRNRLQQHPVAAGSGEHRHDKAVLPESERPLTHTRGLLTQRAEEASSVRRRRT
jgi:hypothetical protein